MPSFSSRRTPVPLSYNLPRASCASGVCRPGDRSCTNFHNRAKFSLSDTPNGARHVGQLTTDACIFGLHSPQNDWPHPKQVAGPSPATCWSSAFVKQIGHACSGSSPAAPLAATGGLGAAAASALLPPRSNPSPASDPGTDLLDERTCGLEAAVAAGVMLGVVVGMAVWMVFPNW